MMAARKRGTVDLSAAIGAEAAEHQDHARTSAAPVAEAAVPAPAPPAVTGEPVAAAVSEPESEAVQDEAAAGSESWDARMSMTLSKKMKRDLDIARAEDGIEGTARVRAMIRLWQQDERLRRRIDKLARTLR